MTTKRLSTWVFLSALVLALLVPTVALAATGATVGDGMKTLGAALALGLSALGAGWAQSKIGAAGQATIAERPEERIWVITLTALPEIIVLLGFVSAILLNS
jgi:V/A-type H+/Na+-transporting ATPase subunit K